MHRRLLLLLLPCALTGCAPLPPSLATAGNVAREVACTVCGAAGGPSEEAAVHAAALRALAEALAPLAARGAADAEVRALLGRLEAAQTQQRADFDRLVDLARRAPAEGAP